MFGDDSLMDDDLITKTLDRYSLSDILEMVDLTEENVLSILVQYKVISEKDLREIINDEEAS